MCRVEQKTKKFTSLVKNSHNKDSRKIFCDKMPGPKPNETPPALSAGWGAFWLGGAASSTPLVKIPQPGKLKRLYQALYVWSILFLEAKHLLKHSQNTSHS